MSTARTPFQTATVRSSSSFNREPNYDWDAIEALEIVNPDTGTWTCPGIAPSRGCRRCRWGVDPGNQVRAMRLLQSLPELVRSTGNAERRLRQIATLLLCNVSHHHNPHIRQLDDVVEDWQTVISSLGFSTNTTASSSGIQTASRSMPPYGAEDSYHNERITRLENNMEEIRNMMQNMMQTQQQQGGRNRGQRTTARQDHEEEEERERERCEEERQEQERQRREEERQEQERQRREEERQEQERQRREEKRREQEQRDREERLRQRAQQRRDTEVRQRAGQAARERQEWAESWRKYATGWENLKNSPPLALTRDNIPWPVKSGCFADLSDLAVREFFNNACPAAANATLMFRVMQGESLKWHSDRWSSALPGFVIGDQERGVLHTIWHVVFELREQAQARRTSRASLS